MTWFHKKYRGSSREEESLKLQSSLCSFRLSSAVTDLHMENTYLLRKGLVL